MLKLRKIFFMKINLQHFIIIDLKLKCLSLGTWMKNANFTIL